MTINLISCIQNGRILVDTISSGFSHFNFLGHWVESGSLAGATAFQNTSGQAAKANCYGGRYNHASSGTFFGGTSPWIVIADGITFNSNDASVCNILPSPSNTVNSGTGILDRNITYLNGAILPSGYRFINRGNAS